MGALFFYIVTKNKLPKFESNIEYSQFLNYGLNARLNSAKCPENLALIIKKALDPNPRFNSTQELLYELKNQLTVENRHISDSQILESTTQILDSTILTIKENIFNFNSLSDLNYKQNPAIFNGAIIAAITIIASLIFIVNLEFKSSENYSINESTSKQGLEIIKNNLFKKGSINNDDAKSSYAKLDMIKIASPTEIEKKSELPDDFIKLNTSKWPSENIKNSNKQEQTTSLPRTYSYRFNPQSELQKLLNIERQKELCLN